MVSLARLGIFYLPTCVGFGTVARRSTLRSFSWQRGINQSIFSEESTSHHLSGLHQWIYLPVLPTGLDHHFQSVAGLASCVTPWLTPGGTGILNLFPIAYAFRPRLRGRLTLGGRTCPRNPWDFGGKDSHLTFRYSCPHNHFHTVHRRLPFGFDPYGTLLYPVLTLRRAQYSRSVGSRFSPDHFRRGITRLVSNYALFKWWLPLSQHPSCLCNPTSLVT
jgi:hypothetical protein